MDLKEVLQTDHGLSPSEAEKLIKENEHIVNQGVKATADRLATVLRDSPPTEPEERDPVKGTTMRKGFDAFK